jgi:hypothetical protein
VCGYAQAPTPPPVAFALSWMGLIGDGGIIEYINQVVQELVLSRGACGNYIVLL